MSFYLASKAEIEDMNDIIHSVQGKKTTELKKQKEI